MSRNETCTVNFGEASNAGDIEVFRHFLLAMRNGHTASVGYTFKVELTEYKFISREGAVEVERQALIDITRLFELSGRNTTWSSLYTYNGLVPADLLRLIEEAPTWDGYRLEITLRGSYVPVVRSDPMLVLS